jgi:hypothetical protein
LEETLGKRNKEFLLAKADLANTYGTMRNATAQKPLLEEVLTGLIDLWPACGYRCIMMADALPDNMTPDFLYLIRSRKKIHIHADNIATRALSETETQKLRTVGDFTADQTITDANLIRNITSIIGYGPEYDIDIIRTRGNLGNAYGVLGDIETQLTMLQDVVTTKQKIYGAKHLELARSMHNLALAYGNCGYLRIKLAVLEKCLEIKETHYLPTGLRLEPVITLRAIAQVHFDLGFGNIDMSTTPAGAAATVASTSAVVGVNSRAYHQRKHVETLTKIRSILEAQPQREMHHEAIQEINKKIQEIQGVQEAELLRGSGIPVLPPSAAVVADSLSLVTTVPLVADPRSLISPNAGFFGMRNIIDAARRAGNPYAQRAHDEKFGLIVHPKSAI